MTDRSIFASIVWVAPSVQLPLRKLAGFPGGLFTGNSLNEPALYIGQATFHFFAE
jgi:hypothetical protein